MKDTSKYLENPVPHLQKAQKAASNILHLQKRLFTVRAEQAAAHQLRKIGLLITSIAFAVMAFGFAMGWGSVALHDAGWGADRIALISFALFGLISVTFIYSFKSTPDPSDLHHSEGEHNE